MGGSIMLWSGNPSPFALMQSHPQSLSAVKQAIFKCRVIIFWNSLKPFFKSILNSWWAARLHLNQESTVPYCIPCGPFLCLSPSGKGWNGKCVKPLLKNSPRYIWQVLELHHKGHFSPVLNSPFLVSVQLLGGRVLNTGLMSRLNNLLSALTLIGCHSSATWNYELKKWC